MSEKRLKRPLESSFKGTIDKGSLNLNGNSPVLGGATGFKGLTKAWRNAGFRDLH